MKKPESNGIVELVDEKQGLDSSWNCMDFHLFSFKEKINHGKPHMPVFLLQNQGIVLIKIYALGMWKI